MEFTSHWGNLFPRHQNKLKRFVLLKPRPSQYLKYVTRWHRLPLSLLLFELDQYYYLILN